MLRAGRAHPPSLVTRLLLVTAAIGAVVLCVAGLALVENAKRAIELEVNAGRTLARDYVIAAVGSLMRTNSPQDAVSFLPTTLFQPRHVKIAVIDRVNGVTHFPRPRQSEGGAEGAPGWFVRLLAPPPQELHLPIRVGMDSFGTVIITTAPEDEINEVWEDFSTLTVIGLVAYLVTLAVLWRVLNRALRPLTDISSAFSALEEGDFSTRIGQVSTPDFTVLAERFDRLADTVERTLADKDALNRRLVELQDAERRAIAMELHDELGPCLFGLRVEARAIRDTARTLKDDRLATRAATVLEIVTQIQETNRALLARLRPMEIGQLPLSRLLPELIERMKPLDPKLIWHISTSAAFDTRLSEAEELHIYRIVQEAVTNVLRHAKAKTVSLTLEPDPKGGGGILLEITDDGLGWQGHLGSGISGMRERAQSLGGRLAVERLKSGTRVRVLLPVLARPALEEAPHAAQKPAVQPAGKAANEPGPDQPEAEQPADQKPEKQTAERQPA